MSLGTVILETSLTGLIIGVAYLNFKRRGTRGLLPGVLMIAFALGVFAFLRPDSIETKGAVDEMIPVVFCYLSMLLGMVAEYGYAQAEQGRKRLKFEPMQFLMPIFASPIVFIPLLTITTDMSLGGAFTKAKLMVYLVAFQNGFFWKSFFEQRRQQAAEGLPAMSMDIPKPPDPPKSRAAAAG